MTGEQLRERLGPFECYTDQDTQLESIKFENDSIFRRINKKVRVIARATPIDKFILIRGIQQQSGMIGMAGDSIADSVALKTANVGFCMGSGCDVAKDNSDLIMEDNDFASIMSSIQWGRATFINSRKFIVFQFTVSLSMLITCFISGLTLGNLPFNVLQMLWLNLVMDILAAIALGTGREESKDRISRKFKVFKAGMYRQIMAQSAFQIIFNLMFIYFGGLMFNKPYNLVTQKPDDENKQYVDTFIFHTFFMMTMFNQICSRVVDDNDHLGVFKKVCSNKIFWIVWIIEMFIEHMMLMFSGTSETGKKLLKMSPLPFEVMCISTLIGALSFVVHIIQTKIPVTAKVYTWLDEEGGFDAPCAKENSENFMKFLFKKLCGCCATGDDDTDEDEDDMYNRMDNQNDRDEVFNPAA